MDNFLVISAVGVAIAADAFWALVMEADKAERELKLHQPDDSDEDIDLLKLEFDAWMDCERRAKR